MSLSICIPDLIAQGKLTGRMADRATDLYAEYLLQYEGQFGRAAAESMATKKTMEALEAGLVADKRLKVKQAQAQARILYDVRTRYDGGKIGDGPIGVNAMAAHLVFDEKAGGIANVEYRWHNVKQTALARMYDVLAKHRRDFMGRVRNPDDLSMTLRELHGEDTGDLNAREMAEGWRAAAEFLRQRFNAAGGSIGKLDDWGIPHSHDAMRVGAVDRESWIAEIWDMLDRDRMVDRATGEPLSDARLQMMLTDMYEGIVSEGWSRRLPSSQPAGRSVANRHAEQRVLHFKSADDWMAYNDRFGALEPWDAMMNHVDRMARDIAMTEILGPNPAATIRWMKEVIERDAALMGTVKDRVKRAANDMTIDALFDEITGQNRRVANRNLALFGSTIRNWQVSTKLGSATLSAISDAGTQMVTRKFNGLPAVSTMGGYLKQLNPADPETREFARRAGLIGEEFIGRVNAGSRFQVDELHGGRLQDGSGVVERNLSRAADISGRLADANIRASGLNAWTVAGREAMGMEFMSAIATYAMHSFDNLNPQFRGFLERYGMGEAEWDAIRTTQTRNWKGMDWIMPEDIADRALADRLFEAMLTEIDFAVPTGGLRQRAMVNAMPRGTWTGELIRTGFQFKMFPITVISMHGARMMAQAGLQKKAIYGVAFLGATTLTGALGVQLSEVSKGRDPLPMDNEDFMYKSMLKGGGLGIYGDLINQSTGEYGQDIGDITAGPAMATAQNTADLIWGVEKKGPDGKTYRHHDLAKFLKRETPGSSVWYFRAAYERLLINQLDEWQGKDISKSRKALERRAAEDGTDYFWRPYTDSPDRAPDFANAIDGELPE